MESLRLFDLDNLVIKEPLGTFVVGSGHPIMVWVWKISTTINPKIFNFWPLDKKKISSGWVKKYLGQRRADLLFTVGKKYALVGSKDGPWPDPTRPELTFYPQ